MARMNLEEMSFASIYPLYITKVEKKGRTKKEVDQVLTWLTGYSVSDLKKVIDDEITLKDFICNAPKLNPDRKFITGIICGVRIEEIKEQFMREIQYMDKLIDELAKSRKMEKILNRE